MKKILFILIALFNCSIFFEQANRQSIDWIDWDKSKESIINDLRQNGWELKIEDRFNSITATNPSKPITFCCIE